MGRHQKRHTTGVRAFPRRRLVAAAAAGVAFTASGAAYAYWTTTGGGTASGTTAANTAVTISQDGSVTGMVPGAAAKDINYTVHNGASTPQFITTITIGISGITYTAAAGAGTGSTLFDHPAGMAAVGCSATDFTIVQPDAVGVDVAAGDTSFTRATAKKSGTIVLVDAVTNQDGCKGTTVALTLTAA
jgi:hypothetical protein